MNYQEYLRGRHWKQFREKVLEFWDNSCALCCSKDRLEVHHRTYDRIGNERITDCIVLCHNCHKIHSKEVKFNKYWGETIFEIRNDLGLG